MSTAADTVRPLSCPNCGGTIALRAAGTSVSLVCEHCGTTLDATTPELSVIAGAQAAMRRPEIALGTRAVLGGTTWETIGYQERTDDEVEWREYLLFNPYEGYAFLIDDGRRFSLGRLLTRLPDHDGGGMTIGEGARLTPFGAPYTVRTSFVVGEFYWRVRVGEEVTETDWTRPGTMLVCEENASERTWTRADLLPVGVAEKAFGIPKRSAWGGGPAPHERSPYLDLLKEALIVAAAAVLVLLFLAGVGSASHRVTTGTLAVPLDGTARTAVIGPFDLPDRRAAVSIAAAASGLDNMWVDLDYSLVNVATQESFDAYATAEAYHGSDSDGDWREGDANPRVRLASIPRGRYQLVVDASAHRWIDPNGRPSGNSFSFSVNGQDVFGSGAASGSATPDPAATIPVAITVDRGGSFGGNVLIALLLIALWPLVLLFLHRGFEKRRMAPTTSGDDEDDD